MNSEIEEIYPLIGQEFYDLLPLFIEAWVTIEIVDDVWGSEAFFRDEKGEINYFNEGLFRIENLFIKMRNEFKISKQEPFTQAMFYLKENGKFSIEFGYEDVSDFGLAGERRKVWMDKTFGEALKVNWG